MVLAMEPRKPPLSVSIVAWVLLAFAVVGAGVVFHAFWRIGALNEQASFLTMFGIAAAIQVTIAVGLLKGSNGARQLFVWLPPVGIVIAIARGTATESTAVVAYLWAVCMFVLTSPSATLFFTGAVSRSLAAQVTRWMSCLVFPNACVVALWAASLYARADDHQAAADEARMSLQKMRSGYGNEISARGAENDALHRDLAAAERQGAELQAKLSRVESERDALAEHVSTTRELMNKLMSATSKLEGDRSRLRARIAVLESGNEAAKGDTARFKSKAAERELEIASLKKRAAALEASNKKLLAEQAKQRELVFWAKAAMDLNRRIGRIDDVRQLPESRVASVDGDLVEISVGSEDKVRSGDVYQLSRGNVYVGSITITKVAKKVSVGVFDEKNKGKGAPPRTGDRVWNQ